MAKRKRQKRNNISVQQRIKQSIDWNKWIMSGEPSLGIKK